MGQCRVNKNALKHAALVLLVGDKQKHRTAEGSSETDEQSRTTKKRQVLDEKRETAERESETDEQNKTAATFRAKEDKWRNSGYQDKKGTQSILMVNYSTCNSS